MAGEELSKLAIEKTERNKRPLGWKRGRWFLSGGLVFVLVVFIWMGGFSPATDVQVATVSLMYPSQAITKLNASGYVVAQRKAELASQITARLVELLVEEGSHVRRNQIVAKLEKESAEASLDQTRAELDAVRFSLDEALAELEDSRSLWQRNKEMIGQGFVSQSEYDASLARYKKAQASVRNKQASIVATKAALRNAKVQVEYSLLRAPFDGVVLTKNADIGDIVTPLGAAANAKASVVTLADLTSLQVEVDVSEVNISQVAVGQPCEIQLDALPGERFAGKVHMVVPTADRTKASVLVKVSFAKIDIRILPEMSAKVAFLERKLANTEQIPVAAIPSEALMNKGQHSLVFVVRENKVWEVRVTKGRTLGNQVEIRDGLQPGDKVVLSPLENLSQGKSVKVMVQ